MVTARRRESWQHTVQLITKLHNVNCVRRSHMISEAELVSRWPFADNGDQKAAIPQSSENPEAWLELKGMIAR